MLSKIREKASKLIKYIKLEWMFAKKSEFRRLHPELVYLWKRKFFQMIRHSSDRTFPIATEFLNAKIEKISGGTVEMEAHTPVLLCALKNDIEKLYFFMEHYRNLGIKNFVFLDNMSTDGTFEYLLRQPDAIVYRCEHTYSSDRKIAWLNRLIAEIGINRWYLMVDSDEFFTFLGAKEHNINDFVMRAEMKGLKRIGVIHLDMYPKESLFSKNDSQNFMERYCYFDTDTYKFSQIINGMVISGGPRKRVFGTSMKVSGYRLCFFEEDDIVPSSHFMIPFIKSYGVPVYLISLHYKFVNESDYDKMIEAVETGRRANNSAEYKTYYKILKDNPNISLYDENHSLPFTEENVKKIEFIHDMFMDESEKTI